MTGSDASTGVAVFDTPIGPCAIAWGDSGIVGVMLPEPTPAQTRARLLRRHPGAAEAEPPPPVRAAIADIRALLSGAPQDLAHIALDMAGVPAFNRRVYALAREIPPGETRTYGEIATRLGDRALSQRVGQALGRNPFPIIVPCHRVLAAHGASGGFSAPGGVATKLRMLSIEGARTSDQPMLFDRLDFAVRGR